MSELKFYEHLLTQDFSSLRGVRAEKIGVRAHSTKITKNIKYFTLMLDDASKRWYILDAVLDISSKKVTMSKNAEFGSFLRAIREEKGITLREAEAKSGISNSYLNQIETGKVSKPSPAIISKLSELYQVSFELLLEKSGHILPEIASETSAMTDYNASILIIDDNIFDRALVRTLLEKDTEMRYRVLEAENSEEGLLAAEEHRPDIILLDYRLGKTDGLEILKKITSINVLRDSAVIMLTGYGNEEIAVKALKFGAVNYFNKDKLNADTFLPALRQAIKRKSIREILRARTAQQHSGELELQQSITASAAEILYAATRLSEEFPSIAVSSDYAIILKESKKICSLFGMDISTRNGRKNE